MNTRPFTHAAAALAAPFLLGLGLSLAGTAEAGLVRAPAAPGRLQASPQPHLAAPRISLVGASAALQRHCHSPQPLFIVSVTLRNTGGPLAAHHGLASASEDSGVSDGHKRLVSHGMPLPAIAAHGSAVVKIPVQALAPYSDLSGAHKLTVHVLPTSYSGKLAFPEPPTYTFRVRVPKGFCLAKRMPPHGLRPSAQPSLKLNPQPEPPSRR